MFDLRAADYLRADTHTLGAPTGSLSNAPLFHFHLNTHKPGNRWYRIAAPLAGIFLQYSMQKAIAT